jgi:hypothetical protein
MRMYRVYCFDGSGRIVQADWIEAADDSAAVETARNGMDCPRIEIWDRQRLVERIDQA